MQAAALIGSAAPSRALPSTLRSLAWDLLRSQVPVTDWHATGGQGASLPVDRELVRKLGRPALAAWGALLSRRSPDAETHVTLGTLGRLSSLSPHQLKRALRRLRSSGLLEDLGWRVKLVPEGKALQHVEVYLRRVRGLLRLPARGGPVHALLPGSTLRWLREAPGRGGARAGAGRPRAQVGVASPPAAPSAGKAGQRRPSRTPRRKGGRGGDGGEFKPPPRNSNRPPEENQEPDFSPSSAPLRKEEVAAATAAPVNLPQLEGQGQGLAPPDFLSRMPPFPGAAKVPPAKVPPFPRLPADAGDLQLVRLCLAAHALAVEHRTGARPRSAYGGKRLEIHPDFPKLAEFARLLRERGSPPLAWILWSLDGWEDLGRERAAPVRWVLSPERLRQHAGWFGSEGDDLLGTRTILPRSARDLVIRWQRAFRGVLGGEEPEAAAAKAFPDGLYERLLRRAAEERASLEAELRARAEAGEFIW